MTTTKNPQNDNDGPADGSNAVVRGSAAAAATAGYAGVGASGFDLPSFWTALCRYRERHGLTDPQQIKPILDDKDLADLRDTQPARDFSFDFDSDSPRASPPARRTKD
jgi:hypothetical protein